MKRLKLIQKCARILFIVYVVILFLVIVLKFPTGLVSEAIKTWVAGGKVIRLKPQIIPFKTIVNYIQNARVWHDWFFKNLACNIIMFIPYGFLVPIGKNIKRYQAFKVIGSGALLSVIIEVFQWITALGHCDIDDIILNTVGVVIGYSVYRLIRYVFSNFHKTKNQ